MPSRIDTPIVGEFRKVAGDAVLSAFARAKGRYSTAEEQALPLILLDSDAARLISGVCLPVDAGLAGGLATGVLDLQKLSAEAAAAALSRFRRQIGRASGGDRGCQNVEIMVGAVYLR